MSEKKLPEVIVKTPALEVDPAQANVSIKTVPNTSAKTAPNTTEPKTGDQSKYLLQTNESPLNKSQISRKKLANILQKKRNQSKAKTAPKEAAVQTPQQVPVLPITDSTPQQQTNGVVTVSPDDTDVKATTGTTGQTDVSSSSTALKKAKTKESSSSSTKKKRGLKRIMSGANLFLGRAVSPSTKTKNIVPIREAISVPCPNTLIEKEKQAKGAGEQYAAGDKLDYKKLEAQRRDKLQKFACWSTICCFVTMGFVFVAVCLAFFGYHSVMLRAVLLSRERALTDTLKTNWTMEQNQCFLTHGQAIIYKNMTDKHLKLLGHCTIHSNMFTGEASDWVCFNSSEKPPACNRTRNLTLAEGIYIFSNISNFYAIV